MTVLCRAAAISKYTVPVEEARDAFRPWPAWQVRAAAVHELSERLTSVGNYLAAGVRLSEIAPAPGIPPPLSEAITKALGQVEQAGTVIHRYRKLLTKESEVESEREQAIRERAYALWEGDGRPKGKDLEFWVRAETEIAGEPHAGVTDAGKTSGPLQTELSKSAG
jgi:hypothetical protein